MRKVVIISLLLVSISNLLAASISKTKELILIDGMANEKIWKTQQWHAIDQAIIGELPVSSDFSGRYKLVWDKQFLYILAEITDDKLFDAHPNPVDAYWDDDCLEIFIDEDASGGNHQFNFNAFAYHLALDNQVVDIGEKDSSGNPEFLVLNNHAKNRWTRSQLDPTKIIWEVALAVYDDQFQSPSSGKKNEPVQLKSGKEMGFMMAYCDNDGSANRESFIGSKDIDAVNGDKNRGYIDASVFGKIKLVD
ncbi:MAG: CBM9 family sugar-binding protein [Kangiellaceae bacterium]|nr:CBM9 family sugar-binding protein [Kangiellaceae bacterium]